MATRVETERQNGQQADWGNSTMAEALRRMADSEPELAARLVVQSLPVAAAPLPADLSWRLVVDGVGAWEVTGNGNGGAARVVPADGPNGHGDFSVETDPAGLASLAAGSSPLGLILRRRMRLRGKRLKALALRAMDSEAGPGELVRLGLPIDPDLLYRSLAYAFEPEWTRGERFAIAFELYGDGGGRWVVAVNDGEVEVERQALEGGATEPEGPANGTGSEIDTTVRVSVETWRRLLSGELAPTAAAEQGLTQIEGALHPATLFGRWADRAAGVDGPELERESRQRETQQRRAGTWGSARWRPRAP